MEHKITHCIACQTDRCVIAHQHFISPDHVKQTEWREMMAKKVIDSNRIENCMRFLVSKTVVKVDRT